jgi:hypothetical protein
VKVQSGEFAKSAYQRIVVVRRKHTHIHTYTHTYICTHVLTLNTVYITAYINAAYLFYSCGGRAVHSAVYVGESAGRFDRLSRPMDLAFSPERVRYMYIVMNIILSYIHTYTYTYMIFFFTVIPNQLRINFSTCSNSPRRFESASGVCVCLPII